MNAEETSNVVVSTEVAAYITDPFSAAVPAWKVEKAPADSKPLEVEIVTPKGVCAGDDLPVLVYIHGGRYEGGRNTERWTSGRVLVDEGHIVQVRISYRKRLEGFLPFGDEDAHHYRGVDDCQLGLEWVQRNIESFGGDPTNVTLSGQSAGGGIALWLARRDHYRGAFRRMIIISPGYPREGIEQRSRGLRLCMGKALTRKHLRSLSPKQMNKGYKRFRTRFITDMAMGPYPFDGRELVDIPMLMTITTREFHEHPSALWFDNRKPRKTGTPPVEVPQRPLLTRITAEKVLGVQPGMASLYADDPTPAGAILSDSLIRRWAAQALEEHQGPQWLIEYDDLEHCEDLPLIFGPIESSQVTTKEAQKKVRGIALDFIRGEDLSWPQYEVTKEASTPRQALEIYLDGRSEVVRDPLRRTRLSFKSEAQ